MRSAPSLDKERQVPWRDRPLLTVSAASELLGCSPAQIYALSKKSCLTLKRLAGRTLVPTSDVIALLDSAAPWAPSSRAEAAHNGRRQRSSSKRFREGPMSFIDTALTKARQAQAAALPPQGWHEAVICGLVSNRARNRKRLS
jgi:hypothetical protein